MRKNGKAIKIKTAVYFISSLLTISSVNNFVKSNIDFERKTFRFQKDSIDNHPCVIYQKRFDALKKILPKHGTIGYISDDFFVEKTKNDASTSAAKYMLTRYSLAPLIVANNSEHELVVGNFHSPFSYNRLQEMGFVLIKQFGNGVVLFRKENM